MQRCIERERTRAAEIRERRSTGTHVHRDRQHDYSLASTHLLERDTRGDRTALRRGHPTVDDKPLHCGVGVVSPITPAE